MDRIVMIVPLALGLALPLLALRGVYGMWGWWGLAGVAVAFFAVAVLNRWFSLRAREEYPEVRPPRT